MPKTIVSDGLGDGLGGIASSDASPPLQRQEGWVLLRQGGGPSSSAGFPFPLAIEEAEESAVVARRREGGGSGGSGGESIGEGFREDVRELAELLAKINPMANELVLSPRRANPSGSYVDWANAPGACYLYRGLHPVIGGNRNNFLRRKGGNGMARMGRGMDNRTTSAAQSDEVIRRTVYVTDVDLQVTEEQLATIFLCCGQVIDCRICGDPNSVLRFAFVEFTDEEGAKAALSLAGTVLGYYPVRVLPSRTAIAPVNPKFLPRSEDEREKCGRTVYCTNIDRRVPHADVKLFFESVCGEVVRMRLLGDSRHPTRIAFVEFSMPDSAIAALNCSGVILGSLPIRVSPSKTPVRSRRPRDFSQ